MNWFTPRGWGDFTPILFPRKCGGSKCDRIFIWEKGYAYKFDWTSPSDPLPLDMFCKKCGDIVRNRHETEWEKRKK